MEDRNLFCRYFAENTLDIGGYFTIRLQLLIPTIVKVCQSPIKLHLSLQNTFDFFKFSRQISFVVCAIVCMLCKLCVYIVMTSYIRPLNATNTFFSGRVYAIRKLQREPMTTFFCEAHLWHHSAFRGLTTLRSAYRFCNGVLQNHFRKKVKCNDRN